MNLIDFLEPRVEAGQRDLSVAIRILVRRFRSDLFDLLDFDDDAAFLEPHAFLYFSRPDIAPRVPLDRVLTCHQPPLRRPGSGRAPGYRREPVVADRYSVLYDPLFGEHAGAAARSVAGAHRRHAEHVRSSLTMIEDGWPSLARLLARVLRRVVLFEVDGMNSFASPTAHGCVFLNTALGENETFFVEDIVHQAGHVLFTAATTDWPSLLSVDPGHALSALTGRRTEARTISVALHGLVTEALMAQMLAMLSEGSAVPPAMRHELGGRLAFVMGRYHEDLYSIGGLTVFTQAGRELVDILDAVFARLVEELGPVWTRVDLSGQPYNFSYSTYRDRNRPCPAR